MHTATNLMLFGILIFTILILLVVVWRYCYIERSAYIHQQGWGTQFLLCVHKCDFSFHKAALRSIFLHFAGARQLNSDSQRGGGPLGVPRSNGEEIGLPPGRHTGAEHQGRCAIEGSQRC